MEKESKRSLVITAIVLAVCLVFTLVSGRMSSSGGSGVSGTYSGTAQGKGGDVKVTLTLTDSKITDVAIEGKDETPGIGDTAMEAMAKEIKDSGSIGVDTVSGATVTSDAVLESDRWRKRCFRNVRRNCTGKRRRCQGHADAD